MTATLAGAPPAGLLTRTPKMSTPQAAAAGRGRQARCSVGKAWCTGRERGHSTRYGKGCYRPQLASALDFQRTGRADEPPRQAISQSCLRLIRVPEVVAHPKPAPQCRLSQPHRRRPGSLGDSEGGGRRRAAVRPPPHPGSCRLRVRTWGNLRATLPDCPARCLHTPVPSCMEGGRICRAGSLRVT